jgi:hypothetical protein
VARCGRCRRCRRARYNPRLTLGDCRGCRWGKAPITTRHSEGVGAQ